MSEDLELLRARWESAWEPALASWSRFTKLKPPRFCLSVAEEKQESLSGSFAMIRLDDHAVVVSLRQVKQQGLQECALEVLAHEIGHHVYAPGDLRDNARLLARVRAGLPTVESAAGMVANLYTDLLINDRLQRSAGLDMAGVYQRLKIPNPSKLWALYMRIYERLWGLMSGTLTPALADSALEGDADLGARLLRVYAQDWLKGAGRFACLLLRYLMEEQEKAKQNHTPIPWLDGLSAGVGEMLPDGLSDVDDDELDGAIHPSEDPNLTGTPINPQEHPGQGGGRALVGGEKNNYRDPQRYVELMQALGVKVSPQEMVARYYRERALPHLIPFPTRAIQHSNDPLMEGVQAWEPGSPLDELDWVESSTRSPVIIPGFTTVERTWGESQGHEARREAPDLYLGIDCSGSMGNPAMRMSWPVVAGAVVSMSALRVGARVMACLSGEPGQFTQTQGFVRNEREVLHILTSYLGTGYSFGIGRLKETFLDGEAPARPTHLLIVTDADIFYMMKEHKGGWEIAEQALARAGAGGTMALGIPNPDAYRADLDRLIAQGWSLHLVRTQEELLGFARAFARRRYAKDGALKP